MAQTKIKGKQIQEIDIVVVKNTSGATANYGDVGYIDSAGEYKTTTTAQQQIAWFIVLVGGNNNDDIYVTNRGRVVVNYTGTAPSVGDFLVTSTASGLAQRITYMHYNIFAVCTSAGSGGQVTAMLLTGTQDVVYFSPNYIWRNNAHSTTTLTATISGSPSSTSFVLTGISGNKDILAVSDVSQLAKIMVYNSTRGTYRLVTAFNSGTNTATNLSISDSWANGDSITAIYQTINDTTSGQTFVGLDLSNQTEIPLLARQIILQGGASDSGGAGRTLLFHENIAYSVPKILTAAISQTASQQFAFFFTMPMINQRIGMKSVSTGTGTALTVIKTAGYKLAVP